MNYRVKNLKQYNARYDNKVLRILYNEYAKKLCIENNCEELIERFMIEEDRLGIHSTYLNLPTLGKDEVSSILADEDVIWLISTFWKYVCIHKKLKNIRLHFHYGYNGSDLTGKHVNIDSFKVTEKEEELFKYIEQLYEDINKLNGYHILVKFNNSLYDYKYDYILENTEPVIGHLVEVEPNNYGLIIDYSKEAFEDVFYYKKCQTIIDIDSALKNKYILKKDKLLSLCCRFYINKSDFSTANRFFKVINDTTITENLVSELLIKYNISDIKHLKCANKNWIYDSITEKIIKRKSWEAEQIKYIRNKLCKLL